VVEYAGAEGWRGRGIAALAADMRWPFLGELLGGEQVISPRVQLVATPHTRNLSIPNEDARAIDLEDSNLFALNRFNGYDRWEDASRVTYGFEWNYDRPRLSIAALVGQSYRLERRTDIFPAGTGLDARLSDIVGRTTIRYGRLLSFTHRYRLDKDSLSIRRNEIDTTLGTQQTYLTVGYTRLNRDIPRTAAFQDLGDREEIRLGARWKITRNWSVFGSTIIDLTSRGEDPLSLSDGYEPIRHRAGITYQDECFELGVTWRRDYVAIGDARQGNTYQVHIALKNLGF
jgi:LPS-assembly protein